MFLRNIGLSPNYMALNSEDRGLYSHRRDNLNSNLYFVAFQKFINVEPHPLCSRPSNCIDGYCGYWLAFYSVSHKVTVLSPAFTTILK
jgi:hypothetical protein